MTAPDITSDMVKDECARSMFGKPLIENIIRRMLVESMQSGQTP